MRRRPFQLPLASLLLGGIAALVVAPSCEDPVHDQEVAACGPENPQIPQGEYHRAGQPCTVCHGPEGPAQTTFTVAGTIFWQPYEQASGTNEGELGVANATVSLVDDLGVGTLITTNCVGNFWVTAAAYNPAFPILAKAFLPNSQNGEVMFTQISRAGSCAECHNDPPNYNAVGHVYLTTAALSSFPQNETQAACPADPNLADFSVGPP